MAAFGTCIALAPRSAPCYLNRALALSALGRTQKALQDLGRVIELDPTLPAAWLQRGLGTEIHGQLLHVGIAQ